MHTLTGARGTFTIEGGANVIGYLGFTFTGLWNDPASVDPVANPDYTGFKLPQIGGNANTPTFSLHGQADLGLSAYSYDHANEVVHRQLIGAANQVLITNRAPSGSLTVDAPALADLNLIQKARHAEDGALQIVHGSAAGKVVEFNAPKVRPSAPSYQEADGIAQMQVALAMIPATGNDEIRITVR